MLPHLHDDPRYFTAEHRAFREQLRKFVESELVPHADEWEAAGMFPGEVFRELGRRGFLGGSYPVEHGGSGGDYFFTCVLSEEMARCRSGGVTMGTLAHCEFGLRIVSDLGTPEQIEEVVKPCLAGEKIAAICVSEPDAGSNVAGARTWARRDGDDYLVSGSKIYITNGTRADFLTMAVKTTEEGGHHGMSFLVFPTKLDGKPTPGFEVSKSLKKLGMKSSDTALLSFDECRIPRRYLLGEENRGFYYIMRNFQGERLIAAQMSNMRARISMEDAWRYMGERKIFGRYQREFQELRHWMADMLARQLASEAFTYDVTRRFVDEDDPPTKVISMAKYYATENAHHTTDTCLQIFGGMGYMDETPISRAWRDGRLSTIGGGASQVMKEIISKELARESGEHRDDSLYNEEEKLLREQATRFVREKILPRIEEWETRGEMPKSVFQEFGEQGYLGIRANEEFGGAGMRETGVLALAEAIETSTSAGLGAAIMMHAGIVTGIVSKLATETVKKKIVPGAVSGEKVGAMALTEPGAGSDLSSLATTAKKDGDRYVLNGTKTFITNGCWCDFALVLCRTDPGAKGYKGMSVLLVERETPGFSVSRRIDTVGWKPSQTGELVFEDCRVPVENLIGSEGRGFQQVMGFLNWERVMMAYQSVRKAELALTMTRQYIAGREQFGKPVAAFQAVRQRIADMATRIEVTRSLAKEAVRRYMAGEQSEAFVAAAKLLCCQEAQEIIDDCLQLHGGYGYTMEFPIQRLWRDHRLSTIGGGTNEVQREILAKILDASS